MTCFCHGSQFCVLTRLCWAVSLPVSLRAPSWGLHLSGRSQHPLAAPLDVGRLPCPPACQSLREGLNKLSHAGVTESSPSPALALLQLTCLSSVS